MFEQPMGCVTMRDLGLEVSLKDQSLVFSTRKSQGCLVTGDASRSNFGSEGDAWLVSGTPGGVGWSCDQA
jgi:hypothetical protein